MTIENNNWIHELSDSEVVDIRKEDYVYDYKQNNPIRNMFEIIVDTAQAIGGINAKAIRFYNYKIIMESNMINAWWYKAEITECNGKKELILTLRHSKEKFSNFVIRFDKFEIVI